METPPTATAAGGMHPTGMHSCLVIKLKVLLLKYSNIKEIISPRFDYSAHKVFKVKVEGKNIN